MRWIIRIGVLLMVVVVGLLVMGFLRPPNHVAVTQSHLYSPPDEVWSTLADWERWGEWHPEVRTVERLPDRGDRAVLMTRGSWGDVPTEIVQSEPPRLFVTEVDGGGFRGRWTYRLEPSAGGTDLTITEEGEVSNVVFRAMLIFHDNYETMLGFHRALGQRLGETTEPVRIDPSSS